jgi:hypothetical protein
MAVDATDGDYLIRRSKRHIRYQPGKSLLALLTGVLGAPVANVEKRMGLFNADSGVFLQLDGTALSLSIRDDAVDVAQESWNLDTMDGTGRSGANLDTTKIQILVIDLQWLGAGRVRAGFDMGGEIVYCHEFKHANEVAATYMTTANLPICYEIRNNGGTGGVTNDFKQVCSAVMSEGGFEELLGVPRSASSSLTTPVTVGTTDLVPVMSLRPKQLLNSIVNRVSVLPLSVDLLVTTNTNVYWALVLNGTLTGESFAEVDAASASELDLAATAIAGGLIVAGGYLGGGTKGQGTATLPVDLSRLLLTRNIPNDDGDVLTLVARSLSGSSSVYGSMVWKEEF